MPPARLGLTERLSAALDPHQVPPAPRSWAAFWVAAISIGWPASMIRQALMCTTSASAREITAGRPLLSGPDPAAGSERADTDCQALFYGGGRPAIALAAAGARSRWGEAIEFGPGKKELVRPEMRYPNKPSHSLAAMSSR